MEAMNEVFLVTLIATNSGNKRRQFPNNKMKVIQKPVCCT